MKMVQVILVDSSEIPATSHPQISEYQQSIHQHFALALALVHDHSRSDCPVLSTGFVSQSGEGFALCSAESGLAAPLAF